MNLFSNLATGFEVAFTLQNLIYSFIGCFLGTLIGVLPGIGPLTAITILLPITYTLPPIASLIMLAGIYYGSQYGGSTTSILMNLPGEPASVVTVIDGYQMAKNGRAGPALAAAGIASFFAGCLGTLVLAGFAIPLTKAAFYFGPTEYFSLLTFGLVGAVILSSESLLEGMGMMLIGLLLGTIGTDLNSGVSRFIFNTPELYDGLGFVIIATGCFGYGEIISTLTQSIAEKKTKNMKISNLMPTKQDILDISPAIFRGSILGCLVGIFPGGGAAISSFAAYALEKKIISRPNEVEFGQGNIRGVAAPEAANNAAAQTSFIPMLALGVPSNTVMALMLGAMMLHGIQPGPQVISHHPQLFWGLVASMWVGNLMLLILNLPLVGIWTRFLNVPYKSLYPTIMLFCAIGAYSTNNSVFEIWMVGIFGIFGHLFNQLGLKPAPLLLGFILGPMIEEYFLRTLTLSRGEISIFITRPLSAIFLLASLASIIIVVIQFKRLKTKALD